MVQTLCTFWPTISTIVNSIFTLTDDSTILYRNYSTEICFNDPCSIPCAPGNFFLVYKTIELPSFVAEKRNNYCVEIRTFLGKYNQHFFPRRTVDTKRLKDSFLIYGWSNLQTLWSAIFLALTNLEDISPFFVGPLILGLLAMSALGFPVHL